MVAPIKPSEVVALKKTIIPDAVIETFNYHIAQNMSGKRSTVKKKDIVAALEARGFDTNEIYDKNYLDVEDVYRAEGWRVVYDKPAYNESYDAFYEFTVQ